jgi:hypothetical protein
LGEYSGDLLEWWLRAPGDKKQKQIPSLRCGMTTRRTNNCDRNYSRRLLVLDVAAHFHADDAAVVVEDDCSGERWILLGRGEWDVEESEVAEGDGGKAVFVGTFVGDDGVHGPVEVGSA